MLNVVVHIATFAAALAAFACLVPGLHCNLMLRWQSQGARIFTAFTKEAVTKACITVRLVPFTAEHAPLWPQSAHNNQFYFVETCPLAHIFKMISKISPWDPFGGRNPCGGGLRASLQWIVHKNRGNYLELPNFKLAKHSQRLTQG